MAKLKELGDCHQLSAVDRTFFNTFVVAFHHSSAQWQLKTRIMSPSFFLEQAPSTSGSSHIHIVEFAVVQRRAVMLCSFRSEPATTDIAVVQQALLRLLDLQNNGIWLVTVPWFYDNRNLGPLFRPDGMVNINVLKQTITPRLRAAIAVRSTANGSAWRDDSTAVLAPANGRSPRLIVVWLRQSNRKGDSNIGKQLWCILNDFPTSLLPLQENDTITIAVEFCSSILHPWNDRRMTSKVLNHIRASDKQSFVLTVCADRLSRRQTEIVSAINYFQTTSTIWMFRGMADESGTATGVEWLDGAEQEMQLHQTMTSCKYNFSLQRMPPCLRTRQLTFFRHGDRTSALFLLQTHSHGHPHTGRRGR